MIHWVVTADPLMQSHPIAWMLHPGGGSSGGGGGVTQLLSPTRSPLGSGTNDSNSNTTTHPSSSSGLAYGQQPVTRRTLSAHGTSPLSRLNASRGSSAHSPSKGSVQGQGLGQGQGQYNSMGASSPTNNSNNNNNHRQTPPVGTEDTPFDPSPAGGIPGAWAYFIARIFEHSDPHSHPQSHHHELLLSNGQPQSSNPSSNPTKGVVKQLLQGQGNVATNVNVEGVAYMLDTLREGTAHRAIITSYHSTLSLHPLNTPTQHPFNTPPYHSTLSSYPINNFLTSSPSMPLYNTYTTGPPKLQQAYLNIINIIFAGEVLSHPSSSTSFTPSSSVPPSPHSASRNNNLNLNHSNSNSNNYDPHDDHNQDPATSSAPTPRTGE